MNSLTTDRKLERLKDVREHNFGVWKAFLQKHLELVDCQANWQLVEEYIDTSDELTEQDFEFVIGNIGKMLAKQIAPTPAELVQQENERRRNLTIPELKKLAKEENPHRIKKKVLPNDFVFPGSKRSVELNRENLIKMSTDRLGLLIRRFGLDCLNQRLDGKEGI